MARSDSLGEIEKSIVVAAHLRASESAKELARIVRMQERTVRYHLHRLEQRGIIRKVPFINVTSHSRQQTANGDRGLCRN